MTSVICGESRKQKKENIGVINDYADIKTEDMKMVGVTIEDVCNKGRWRQISAGREQPKYEK